ncbi:MAG: PHP domain-containing protein [Verrucomicrobiota bacterium]
MIKIDFHIHTGEDPYDGLSYPATVLIDKAATLGYGAIAITLHKKVLEDERYFEYARKKGVLLIRACESRIQKIDVLLYNVTQREVDAVRTFEDLRAFRQAKGDDILVIAPHPFYPINRSLKHRLIEHIDLFDAIEHAQLHLPWLNFNPRAVRVAQQYRKPIVANSDAHSLWMFGRHYTLVDAALEVHAIFAAIRQNRLEWHSPPVTVWECLKMFVVDPLLHRKKHRIVRSFPDQLAK